MPVYHQYFCCGMGDLRACFYLIPALDHDRQNCALVFRCGTMVYRRYFCCGKGELLPFLLFCEKYLGRMKPDQDVHLTALVLRCCRGTLVYPHGYRTFISDDLMMLRYCRWLFFFFFETDFFRHQHRYNYFSYRPDCR